MCNGLVQRLDDGMTSRFKFNFFCLKLIIVNCRTPKKRKIKFEPRINLNCNGPLCMLYIHYGGRRVGEEVGGRVF